MAEPLPRVPASILRPDGSVLEFSVVEREAPERKATATAFPVETGAPLTDHVRVDPDALQVEAAFPADVADAARDTLHRIYDATPPEVLTYSARRVYPDLVLLGIGEPRDKATGDAWRVTLRFQRIRRAATQRTRVKVTQVKRGKPNAFAGAKATTATPASTQSESALYKIGSASAGQDYRSMLAGALGNR